MGTLYVIGIGLQPGHLSIESMNLIKSSDEVFAELYTSKSVSNLMDELERLMSVRPILLGRRDIEDEGGRVLMKALDEGKSVVLLTIGDPLMATTHGAVAVEAARRGHSVRIINSVSIVCAAFSQSGLSPYKMGPTATITHERLGYRSKRHVDVLLDNLSRGLHTLLLLDIDDDGGFMDARRAAELASNDIAERGLNPGELLVIYLARIGWSNQTVIASAMNEPPNGLGEPPHALLVPGALNAVEEEFLLNVIRADPNLLEKHKGFTRKLFREAGPPG